MSETPATPDNGTPPPEGTPTDPSGVPATPPGAVPPEGDQPPDLLGTESLEGQGIDPGPPDTDADGKPTGEAKPDDGKPAERPEYIEEKFWDAEKGEIRTEALAKSYGELQRKLSSGKTDNVSAGVPEKYELELPEGVEELSESDEQLFKDMGLNNEQAQKVLNHLTETVIPELTAANTRAETTELAAQWDMKPGSPEMRARVDALRGWAKDNLPESVVKHMSRSAAGVQQLWALMQSGAETSLQGGQPRGTQRASAEELQSMMDDKYWEGDPARIAEVERRAGLR